MKKSHLIAAVAGTIAAAALAVTAVASASSAADTDAPTPPSVHKTITGW